MFNLSTISFRDLFEYVANMSSKFEDGRVNYRTSRMNLVLGILILKDDKVLLLKRSHKVLTYAGLWDFVGGYLDDGHLPKQKALMEIEEELGIGAQDIESIETYTRVIQYDDVINKVRVNFPVLVRLRPDAQIVLDEEHTEYVRIDGNHLNEYELAPGVPDVYDYIYNYTQGRLFNVDM